MTTSIIDYYWKVFLSVPKIGQYLKLWGDNLTQ